jgi:outer membrane protein assembly factor BamA
MTPFVLTIALLASPPAQVQTPVKEVVAEIRVHGNQIVPDAEVVELAGVVVGVPFTEAVIASATRRLRDSGKFESIDVLKRFASIEDASRIIIVIIVNEGPVRIVMPGVAGAAAQIKKRTFFRNLMFVPVLEAQDGYGFTFGARVAYPKAIGPNSRMSFPMMWGGTKRIGVEVDRTFTSGPFSRIEFGGVLQRRRNPAFDENDDRQRLWGRAQRFMGPVRTGVTGGWQDVSFGERHDRITSVGVDVTLDTRENPALPRNAVLVTALAERLFFDEGEAFTRTRVDAFGYIGLFGQHVLVVHAVHDTANHPLPLYLRPILGGTATLRGFKTGFMTGDTLAAGSIEWRAPISSPLNFGKLGVSAFVDAGAAWDRGQSLRDQRFRRGVGGSVWFSVASFRLSVAVARGLGSGLRAHFSGTLGF